MVRDVIFIWTQSSLVELLSNQSIIKIGKNNDLNFSVMAKCVKPLEVNTIVLNWTIGDLTVSEEFTREFNSSFNGQLNYFTAKIPTSFWDQLPNEIVEINLTVSITDHSGNYHENPAYTILIDKKLPEFSVDFNDTTRLASGYYLFDTPSGNLTLNCVKNFTEIAQFNMYVPEFNYTQYLAINNTQIVSLNKSEFEVLPDGDYFLEFTTIDNCGNEYFSPQNNKLGIILDTKSPQLSNAVYPRIWSTENPIISFYITETYLKSLVVNLTGNIGGVNQTRRSTITVSDYTLSQKLIETPLNDWYRFDDGVITVQIFAEDFLNRSSELNFTILKDQTVPLQEFTLLSPKDVSGNHHFSNWLNFTATFNRNISTNLDFFVEIENCTINNGVM